MLFSGVKGSKSSAPNSEDEFEEEVMPSSSEEDEIEANVELEMMIHEMVRIGIKIGLW